MSAPKVYCLASIKINTTVFQVMDGSLSENIKQVAKMLGGTYQVSYRGILERDPKISGKTTDIAGFLTAVGIIPAIQPVVLGFIDVATDGTRGVSGYTVSLASAYIIPRTLNCSQGGEATIAFEVHAISADGITSPITYAAAAPDLPTVAGVYTLGAGGTITGVQSMDLNFGIKEKVTKADGAIYPQRCHIESQEPVLKLKTTDLSIAVTPAGVTAYVTKLLLVAHEGFRGATVVTITIPDGLQTVNQVSGAHPGEGSVEMVISAVKGSGAILTVAAA